MDTATLKKFAQYARRSLMEQVAVKLATVLTEGSPARRESPAAVAELEKAIAGRGQEQIVERVAYIWFNRFCALRFMDVNNYANVGVVSPAQGQTQPEILAEAKQGHIDEELVSNPATRERVFALLRGNVTSNDPQAEAYRLLLVAVCNYWHKSMPFMFERINDYAELLMPDDLLSESSILAQTREAMTLENCEDVEVIGWLYQFYILEKKEQVEKEKRHKKVTPENIPAATQHFTPHWIVRYLVENSLGRLWLLNRPGSKLAERMDYYIAPETPESDFLRVASPEAIKICDPACGSGHMLTYAFDLLQAIYEEEGYAPLDIPGKILAHNLYGVEIDERAGALAAFALSMKARARQRGFFKRPVQPNICVLQNISFKKDELTRYMDFAGRDLFTAPLMTALHQFGEADNFGSLIRPVITNARDLRKRLEAKNVGGNLLLHEPHQKVLRILEQSEYLSSRYHVVIANPPYMGGKGMNGRLGAWAKDNYPNSKSDLFAMFIERNFELTKPHGMVAMITMQSWMFLSSFENLRIKVIEGHSITGLTQIGYNSFPELNSKVALASAFIISMHQKLLTGAFINLNDAPQSADKEELFRKRVKADGIFRLQSESFSKIPGTPFAYWISRQFRDVFSTSSPLTQYADFRIGMATGNNDSYVRNWSEVSSIRCSFHSKSRDDAATSDKKWFPYAKGGAFRRWAGNEENVVNWERDGHLLQTTLHPSGERIWGHNFNLDNIFKPSLCWTQVTTGKNSFRFHHEGFLFDAAAGLGQPKAPISINQLISLLNCKVSEAALAMLNPTINLLPGNLGSLPYKNLDEVFFISALIQLSKFDWDSYEISWDFTSLPLLSPDYRKPFLDATYSTLRTHWREMTLEMQLLEEENNRIFIEAYGLQDELTPEVPLKEITLTCNPHYRYGGDKTEEELEALLLADTMKEFLSYAVGCMFGRYALEKPGLVLANQGETIKDYLKQIPEPSFPADSDNVIPMLDNDWFTDDATERFRAFLRITFGAEHYTENLAFIENSIGKDIRKYLTKDFYNDHVKRYKKRPIYWLFSSPKGSFNALIYMHRYRPDTVSVVLNDYLREFIAKLATEKTRLEQLSTAANASPAEKSKALKELEKIRKTLKELEDYERDILYPLATRQIEIDLDDGVKVNYPKFGEALKKIPGLDAVEE